MELCGIEQENNSIQSNPAFDFLKEPSENSYSLTDGEPFNDLNDAQQIVELHYFNTIPYHPKKTTK